MSDVPWTREIEKYVVWDGYAYSPIEINPADAEPRGIKEGDICRIYCDNGGVLGGARITERIIAGTIGMEKAGGGHHIIPGELHRGGNPNCINPDHNMSLRAYGGCYTGFLAQIEKVTMAQWDEWRTNYPEAFARGPEEGKYGTAYDPAYGPSCSGWIEGGK